MNRRNSNRLSIESLERRDLMAADAFLTNGVLNVTGTDEADRIIVSQAFQNGLMTVKVSITDEATGTSLVQRSFMNSSVSSMEIKAFGGSDFVENKTNKPSIIRGGTGNDWLSGGSAGDHIFANSTFGEYEPSGTTIFGNGGNDYCYGGSSNDRIEGGTGDDYLYGDFGSDTLLGGANTDRLFGQAGNDTLFGGDATDYLYGGLNRDYLYGDNGDDFLYGIDQYSGADDGNVLYGGAGHDELFGAMGADELYGNAGNDKLHGGGGNDDLFGGSGRDKLWGGEGNDDLWGEGDNDELHGNGGDDFCRGGTGDDFVAGGDGFDTLNGDSDVFSSKAAEDDELIFDIYDVGVDGNTGLFLWPFSPKLVSGAYRGHGVYND